MDNLTSLIGQINTTPAVDGYDCIHATIAKTGTPINDNFSIDFKDLTKAEKAKVEAFTQLMVDLNEKTKAEQAAKTEKE